MNNFEMAHADNPEEIVMATQRSVIVAMIGVIDSMEKDPEVKSNGMSWSQIKDFLKMFGEKKPTIITQTDPI